MKRQFVLILAAVLVAVWTAFSYAANLNVSGHYRVRGFAVENMVTGSATGLHTSGADDSISNADHRFRLNLDVSEGPVMGRLQINSGNYNWGESQDSSKWNREMFLVFPAGSATVKIGKFWAEHPFNGLIFTGVAEQAYYIYPASSDLTLIAAFVDADDSASITTSAHVLVGIYKPKGSMFDGALGFYHVTHNDSATIANIYVKARPMWLAGQLNANSGAISASIVGASLFGDAKVGATSFNYKGYGIDVRATYDFAKAGGPPLSLTAIYGYGSGDDTANDTDIEDFWSPLPSYAHTAIFLDHGDGGEGGAQLSHPARSSTNYTAVTGNAQASGIGNLNWLGIKAAYKLTDKTALNLTGATFSLAENKVTGGTSYSYQSDSLGKEFDIALSHQLAKGLTLTLQGAWFMPNEKGWTTTTSSTTASDDTISEYMAKLHWNF